MKIVTKNYSLQSGKRSYLVYLVDHNDKSLECFDVTGEDKRIEEENKLSKKYEISTKDIEYISLSEFKSQELPSEEPLFLVFYLDAETFASKGLVAAYGENVKKYLDEKGDNVRLFFMPTTQNERIECINPKYIEDENEIEKLDNLVKELEEKFQVKSE